jgi:hypothetical protein
MGQGLQYVVITSSASAAGRNELALIHTGAPGVCRKDSSAVPATVTGLRSSTRVSASAFIVKSGRVPTRLPATGNCEDGITSTVPGKTIRSTGQLKCPGKCPF